MPIGTDFEIQADKDIRYVGAAHGVTGAGYYSVLELHRWLQTLAAGLAASSDDFMEISRPTPSDKAFDTIINLINGYNIDATAAEHLYGGSIIQSNGAEIYDGFAVVSNPGVHVEIVQNGAIVANDFWNTIPFGSSNKGLSPDAAKGVAMRFMLRVRTGGADIDLRNLRFQTREWGKTPSAFRVVGSERGVNVVPLQFNDDLNNTTLEATVAGWNAINNGTAGHNGIDANNDGTNEFYYSNWDLSTFSKNQFFERCKWLQRRGSASTLYGLNGEIFEGITHEINTDGGSGTFSAFEAISWSGGTGQLLARNANQPTKVWMQLLTGVPPTDNQTITGGTSGATCLCNVTVTTRPVSFPFCGQSTGSAIIGAFGFGIEAADLGKDDRLTDLTGATIAPPNFVTFSVGNLVVGDGVNVTVGDGAGIDEDQFTLNGTLTGAAVTSVVVNEAIPTDMPSTGNLRIRRANGAWTLHAYSAYNTGTQTFTITSHNFSSNNAANGTNAYVAPIDKIAASTTESFTTVYAGSPRDLYVRVRNATPGSEIKTYETPSTLGASGGGVNAIRTPD